MKAILNGGEPLLIEKSSEGLLIDGKLMQANLQQFHAGRYHIIADNKSVMVEVISSDPLTKKHTLKINGRIIEVVIKDQYDELLEALGIDVTASKKTGDLKAPMPGLVVDILIEEGQEIKKGETLVVLEAMKMENSLKAASDCIVKKILIKKGSTVDKNQVLIQLV